MSEPRELTDREKTAIRDATYSLVKCCRLCIYSERVAGVTYCLIDNHRREAKKVQMHGFCEMWEGEV